MNSIKVPSLYLFKTRRHFLTFWLIVLALNSISTFIITAQTPLFLHLIKYVFVNRISSAVHLLSTLDCVYPQMTIICGFIKMTAEIKIRFSALKVLYNGNIYCSWHQYCYSLLTIVPWTLFGHMVVASGWSRILWVNS